MLKRVALAMVTAVLCAAYSYWSGLHIQPDFDQWWLAGRALLAGHDVYASVGPERTYPFRFPFYYPLPAAILGAPFALLSVEWARATFAAISGGALALALTRDGTFTRTPALMSGSMLIAIQYGQLSPLLAAALVYPWLAGLVAAKPTAGLAALAAQRDWRNVSIGAAVAACLMLAAFAIDPRWPLKWIATARNSPTALPLVARVGGVILLLAVVRWREPVARWLVTIAVVPLTSPLYEALPLWLAPLTLKQSLTLALLTHAARWVELATYDPSVAYAATMARASAIGIALVYLPALWMLIRRRTDAREPAT